MSDSDRFLTKEEGSRWTQCTDNSSYPLNPGFGCPSDLFFLPYYWPGLAFATFNWAESLDSLYHSCIGKQGHQMMAGEVVFLGPPPGYQGILGWGQVGRDSWMWHCVTHYTIHYITVSLYIPHPSLIYPHFFSLIYHIILQIYTVH